MKAILLSKVCHSTSEVASETDRLNGLSIDYQVIDAIDGTFVVLWSELSDADCRIPFSLQDEVTGDTRKGYIDTNGLGVGVHIEGFGDRYSDDNDGTPLYIESYGGNVQVRVYGDINVEDPTQVINLEAAKLENRLN